MSRYALIGPFKEAQKAAESFTYGIYYSLCMENAVQELMAAEKEYQSAISASDHLLIEKKEKEVSFYENILVLATDAYTNGPSLFESGSYHD